MTIKRGDIFFADLDPVQGSEQGGVRPVLVLQNDLGNKYSPTIICAAITSRMDKTPIPTHVKLLGDDRMLERESIILLEQLRTLDRSRLQRKIGHLKLNAMTRVDEALSISLGL